MLVGLQCLHYWRKPNYKWNTNTYLCKSCDFRKYFSFKGIKSKHGSHNWIKCAICWTYCEWHPVSGHSDLVSSINYCTVYMYLIIIWNLGCFCTSFVEEGGSRACHAVKTTLMLSGHELSVSVGTFWGTNWLRNLKRAKIWLLLHCKTFFFYNQLRFTVYNYYYYHSIWYLSLIIFSSLIR